MVHLKNKRARFDFKNYFLFAILNDISKLYYLAYICTTVGTVVAMIVAFLSSQQTFCFIQLRGDDKNGGRNKNVDQIDSDTILRKVPFVSS